jgi:MoxR-like ATPase
MFEDIAAVRLGLGGADYIASEEIGTTVFLAERLCKPILAEGPAGVGKTELAKAWAAASERPLIRLQCYEGLDESKALYEWEYAKQMLYTQLLRDSLAGALADAPSLPEAARRLAAEEDVFFSDHFLLPRPLLAALRSSEPVVLLVDEIDRADVEFEAFLLEILSDFQVSIPELGTVRARHQPMVLLTSNNTRELSEALKRRCLYLHVDYPGLDEELEIVRLRVPGIRPELARQAVTFVQQIRQMDLRKVPSISETLDWARALLVLNVDSIDRATFASTLNVLLKYEADLAKAQRMMSVPRDVGRGDAGRGGRGEGGYGRSRN